jgi:hypothetical protein
MPTVQPKRRGTFGGAMGGAGGEAGFLSADPDLPLGDGVVLGRLDPLCSTRLRSRYRQRSTVHPRSAASAARRGSGSTATARWVADSSGASFIESL